MDQQSRRNRDTMIWLRDGKAPGRVGIVCHDRGQLYADIVFGKHLVQARIADIDEMMTVGEYAERRNVHRNTVLHWIHSGKLWAIKGKSNGKSAWLIPPTRIGGKKRQ